MKNAGVIFEIPNAHGNYLSEVLEPLSVSSYEWLIDNDEIHLIKNNEFTNEFLFNDERIISGERLYQTSKNNIYYMIFVTLKAFFKDGVIKEVSNYKEFLESDCQIMLGVYDCSYVMFCCKESQLLSNMYMYALSKGYKNVEYISKEDLTEEKYRIE